MARAASPVNPFNPRLSQCKTDFSPIKSSGYHSLQRRWQWLQAESKPSVFHNIIFPESADVDFLFENKNVKLSTLLWKQKVNGVTSLLCVPTLLRIRMYKKTWNEMHWPTATLWKFFVVSNNNIFFITKTLDLLVSISYKQMPSRIPRL